MKILVVEDEPLIALDLVDSIADAGHVCVAVARDRASAMQRAGEAEIAFVDVNLADGPTGIHIGADLAGSFGLAVVYMTSDGHLLGHGVGEALGLLEKPVRSSEVEQLLAFLDRTGNSPAQPPARLKLFEHVA